MTEVDPKSTATDMTYSGNDGYDFGVKKVKCTEHTIVNLTLDKIPGELESASIAYYPTGSCNAPHADNAIIHDNGIITKDKEWTHTAIIFLNNEFTGGELVYPNQGCVFLPSVGTMIIAPAGADYIHFVNEIKSGERFTLVLRII
jgi:hypothetical protein